MKPHVICHMMVSLDGRIHPGRWTDSPDGDRKAWTTVYEGVHGKLQANAWLVGLGATTPAMDGYRIGQVPAVLPIPLNMRMPSLSS